MTPLSYHDGSTRACPEKVWLLFLLILETILNHGLGKPVAYAETRIIPSMSVSERYDSNVWFAPRSLVPADLPLDDFVTTLSPRLEIKSKSEKRVDATLSAGGTANMFAYNKDLGFLSTDVAGVANLDGWVSQVFRGSTLKLSDTFLYTPEPPAFVTGGTTSAPADTFSRGIQAFRANTFSNIASAVATFQMMDTVDLKGQYTNSIFTVGTLFVTGPTGGVGFFDTKVNDWALGPSLHLSRGDTLSLSYRQYQLSQTGAGPTLNFLARGGELEYNSKLAPGWITKVAAGVKVVEPGNSAFATGRFEVTHALEQNVQLQVRASRDIAPAFFGTGGALVSNTASVFVVHRFARDVSLLGSGNAGYSETTPIKGTKYYSYGASGELRYMFLRDTFASLSYTYTYFDLDQVGALPYLVERSVVMLSVQAMWK